MNVGEKAPSREGPCERCGTAVKVSVDAWFACAGCFSRHHEGCWSSHGACARCGGADGLGPLEGDAFELPGARVVPPSLPVLPKPPKTSRAKRALPFLLIGGVVVTGAALRSRTQAVAPQPHSRIVGNADPEAADRESARAHMRRGYALAVSHDYNGALAEYTRATELDPRLVIAWENRAYMAIALEDYDSARVFVARALALSPDRPSALVCRATLGALASENVPVGTTVEAYNALRTAAAADLERATSTNGADVPWKMVARARQLLGDHNGAIAASSRAIESLPDEAFSYVVRGHSWAMIGQLDVAKVDFEKAIALDPMNWSAHDGLGDIDVSRGDYPAAAAEFRRALEGPIPKQTRRKIEFWLAHYPPGSDPY